MLLDVNKQILIFLLLSIGLITWPHVNHIPLSLFLLFNLLLLWRFIGIWKQRCLPNNFFLFILTAGAVILLYTQHIGILGRDSGTSLFVTALGLKLLEIKRERDLYLISYLAFIVASSQFLFQQSIFMAAYILVVCCVLLATLISINSHKPETISALKTATIIVFQAIPLSIVLFVFFPRLEAPRWMLFDQQHSAKTGLSDSLEPGSISSLGLSDELVFRVKFKAGLPPPNQRYWRGPVYSVTDGKRWTQTKDLSFQDNMEQTNFSGPAYQYTLMMEPQQKNWVFALELASSLPRTVKQNGLYQLTSDNHSNQRVDYQLTSYPQYHTGAITQQEKEDNLQLPAEPSARIKQLVTQLHGFDRNPEFYIKSLLNHFKQANFHYTLTPPLMEENPIETFLFESRYGFCSHYATAFVYLMRVAGIPARVVGGYQGGEFNSLGKFLVIKQANAHAWAEVWLANKGWTRFDPTAAIAPERIEQNVNIDLQIATGAVNFSPYQVNAVSWLKKGRQLWNSIDYSWQRWVIHYSRDSRANFLASLGINNIRSMVYWLAGAIALITFCLAFIILKPRSAAVDKELLLYQNFCKKLARAGIHKKNIETAQKFALRVQMQRPDVAANVKNITTLFLRLRYEQNQSTEDYNLLKNQVKKFKVNVKA